MDYSVPILTELVLVAGDIKRTLKAAAHITPEQYQVLAALDGLGPHATPGNLAHMLSLPASSVSTVLDSLKRIGAVSASGHPSDKRIQILALSGAGTVVLRAADHALGLLFERIWRPLSPEQRDITTWGSTGAMSDRRLVRVRSGAIDTRSAYCGAVLLSLRMCRDTLAEHDLSVNEYRVLKTAADLDAEHAAASAQAFCSTLVVSSSLLAQTSGALEKRGLIRRVADTADARIRHIVPTEAGSDALAPARKELLRTMRKGLVPISRYTVDQFGRIAEEVIDTYRRSKELS